MTGFFTLGKLFTAHVTGNLVLAAAAAVGGGPLNMAQILAIPVFISCGGSRLVDRRGFEQTWSYPGATAARGSICPTGSGFDLLHCREAVRRSAWLDGRHRGDDCSLCNGVSVRHASSGAAESGLDGGYDWQLDERRPVADGGVEKPRRIERRQCRSSETIVAPLVGFLTGCLVAAVAVCFLNDFAWFLPAALAALAIAIR